MDSSASSPERFGEQRRDSLTLRIGTKAYRFQFLDQDGSKIFPQGCCPKVADSLYGSENREVIEKCVGRIVLGVLRHRSEGQYRLLGCFPAAVFTSWIVIVNKREGDFVSKGVSYSCCAEAVFVYTCREEVNPVNQVPMKVMNKRIFSKIKALNLNRKTATNLHVRTHELRHEIFTLSEMGDKRQVDFMGIDIADSLGYLKFRLP